MMTYYLCSNNHAFPTKRIHARMMKQRNMSSPVCPVCGDDECERISKDRWMYLTGRLQRNHKTRKKTLRNTYR